MLIRKEVSVAKARKWGPRPENGGLRQVKKTSLSKEDLPMPPGDRAGECYVSWRHGKTKDSSRSREVYI